MGCAGLSGRSTRHAARRRRSDSPAMLMRIIIFGSGSYYQYRCCDRLVVQQNGLQPASRPLIRAIEMTGFDQVEPAWVLARATSEV
jgi:hypothetical protein